MNDEGLIGLYLSFSGQIIEPNAPMGAVVEELERRGVTSLISLLLLQLIVDMLKTGLDAPLYSIVLPFGNGEEGHELGHRFTTSARSPPALMSERTRRRARAM